VKEFLTVAAVAEPVIVEFLALYLVMTTLMNTTVGTRTHQTVISLIIRLLHQAIQ
jgi:hypothetical protein